jgi:hypothetical protein
MSRETYKGRELKVVKARDGVGLVGSINSQPMPTRYGVPEREVIEQFHRDIDHVDQAPIDGGRWGARMYAPGTYELCGIGHPKKEVSALVTRTRDGALSVAYTDGLLVIGMVKGVLAIRLDPEFLSRSFG